MDITHYPVMNHEMSDSMQSKQSKMRRGFPIKEDDIVILRAQPVASRDVGNIFRQDSPSPFPWDFPGEYAIPRHVV